MISYPASAALIGLLVAADALGQDLVLEKQGPDHKRRSYLSRGGDNLSELLKSKLRELNTDVRVRLIRISTDRDLLDSFFGFPPLTTFAAQFANESAQRFKGGLGEVLCVNQNCCLRLNELGRGIRVEVLQGVDPRLFRIGEVSAELVWIEFFTRGFPREESIRENEEVELTFLTEIQEIAKLQRLFEQEVLPTIPHKILTAWFSREPFFTQTEATPFWIPFADAGRLPPPGTRRAPSWQVVCRTYPAIRCSVVD